MENKTKNNNLTISDLEKEIKQLKSHYDSELRKMKSKIDILEKKIKKK